MPLAIKSLFYTGSLKVPSIQIDTYCTNMIYDKLSKRGTKDTKGTVKLINLKQTDNAMAKNEKKNKQKNNSKHDTT